MRFVGRGDALKKKRRKRRIGARQSREGATSAVHEGQEKQGSYLLSLSEEDELEQKGHVKFRAKKSGMKGRRGSSRKAIQKNIKDTFD